MYLLLSCATKQWLATTEKATQLGRRMRALWEKKGGESVGRECVTPRCETVAANGHCRPPRFLGPGAVVRESLEQDDDLGASLNSHFSM